MIVKLLKQRRSIYPQQFNKKPISKDIIQKVLESANWAPTHKKTEPWRFKVIQEHAKLRLGDYLSETYMNINENASEFKAKKISQKFELSDTVIAICMQRDAKERIPEWEEVAATAMAVQNMWLHCAELGIGGYWSSPSLINHLGGFFNFKEGERCLGFFYMGYYDENSTEGYREPIENKVDWLKN